MYMLSLHICGSEHVEVRGQFCGTSFLSFYHMHPRDQTQGVKLGETPLLLSHFPMG